jgi:hypothetical protein
MCYSSLLQKIQTIEAIYIGVIMFRSNTQLPFDPKMLTDSNSVSRDEKVQMTVCLIRFEKLKRL